MTLNLGANGIVLGPSSDRLVLEWGGRQISTLAVIQPQTPVCREKTEPVSLSGMTVVGENVRGDDEFDGNGPRMSTSVDLLVQPTRIDVRVAFRATETESDWSTAAKTETRTAYNVDPQWKITKVNGEHRLDHEFVDADHTINAFSFPGGLVARLEYVGDTGGDDIGKTKVDVTFHRLSVSMVEQGNCVPADSLRRLRDVNLLGPGSMLRFETLPPVSP
jgi:hypothetical protein